MINHKLKRKYEKREFIKKTSFFKKKVYNIIKKVLLLFFKKKLKKISKILYNMSK